MSIINPLLCQMQLFIYPINFIYVMHTESLGTSFVSYN